MTIGLAGKLLAVGHEAIDDVLHQLHLGLLGEMELFKNLLLPPYRSCSFLVIKLVLDRSRFKPLYAYVIQSDQLQVDDGDHPWVIA